MFVPALSEHLRKRSLTEGSQPHRKEVKKRSTRENSTDRKPLSTTLGQGGHFHTERRDEGGA
jgi:hypothetical protein